MGGSLLVGLGGSLVAVLLGLVLQSIDASLSAAKKGLVNAHQVEVENGTSQDIPGAERSVGVLGGLLVGLLGSLVGGAWSTLSAPCHRGGSNTRRGRHTLNLVRDVVAGLLDGIHGD